MQLGCLTWALCKEPRRPAGEGGGSGGDNPTVVVWLSLFISAQMAQRLSGLVLKIIINTFMFVLCGECNIQKPRGLCPLWPWLSVFLWAQQMCTCSHKIFCTPFTRPQRCLWWWFYFGEDYWGALRMNKRPNSQVRVMDDEEYLFENWNVVTSGFSLGLANSIYKAFSVYTICSSIPLLSKIHILISCNFFFVFIPFQGSNCPPVTRVEKKKSHCKLDHLFAFKQTHSGFPSVGHMSASLVVRKIPPHHTTALSWWRYRKDRPGLHFLAILPRAASFLFSVLTISVLSVSSRKEKLTRSTKVGAVFGFA